MPEQDEMDHLLRRVMDAPPPSLSPTFDRRLMKRLRPRRLDAPGRFAMAAYALLALIVSVFVMRAQALDWRLIALAVLVPSTLAWAVQSRRRHPESKP